MFGKIKEGVGKRGKESEDELDYYLGTELKVYGKISVFTQKIFGNWLKDNNMDIFDGIQDERDLARFEK